jgi:hypothetical protein
MFLAEDNTREQDISTSGKARNESVNNFRLKMAEFADFP